MKCTLVPLASVLRSILICTFQFCCEKDQIYEKSVENSVKKKIKAPSYGLNVAIHSIITKHFFMNLRGVE